MCFVGYLFAHTPIFFGKYLNFLGFLSVPNLVDNYAKVVDERGRNLMCNRTLPSLLVLKQTNCLGEKGNVSQPACFRTRERPWQTLCSFVCPLLALWCACFP